MQQYNIVPCMPAPIKLKSKQYSFAGKYISLWVPDEEMLQQNFAENDGNADVPFWARVWPSALGMCQFLEANTAFILGKRVVELGAGLGLPSLLSAHFAKEVLCTDCSTEAMELVCQSVALNKLRNVKCACFNWHSQEALPAFDVLLLSDINYNPADFEVLIQRLETYLQLGVQIMISTPQRIMAKPFVEKLLAYCTFKTTVPITICRQTTEIFIMQLQKQG